ncbi:MAG: hypothetical protein AAGI71_17270 [Bacteroidota bacterium]
MSTSALTTAPLTAAQTASLRTAAVLWIIWGFVHAAAGALIMAEDTTSGFQSIADAVDPTTLVMAYPEAVGAVLNQHAWNLFWGGLVTMVGAVLIWRQNSTAIWVTAMVGGLLDIGYFMFVDLGGYAKFFPGTLMTLISASAIILSGWVWWTLRR